MQLLDRRGVRHFGRPRDLLSRDLSGEPDKDRFSDGVFVALGAARMLDGRSRKIALGTGDREFEIKALGPVMKTSRGARITPS